MPGTLTWGPSTPTVDDVTEAAITFDTEVRGGRAPGLITLEASSRSPMRDPHRTPLVSSLC